MLTYMWFFRSHKYVLMHDTYINIHIFWFLGQHPVAGDIFCNIPVAGFPTFLPGANRGWHRFFDHSFWYTSLRIYD